MLGNTLLRSQCSVITLRYLSYTQVVFRYEHSYQKADTSEPDKFLMYTKEELNAIHVHGTKDTETGDKENLNEQFSTSEANLQLLHSFFSSYCFTVDQQELIRLPCIWRLSRRL